MIEGYHKARRLVGRLLRFLGLRKDRCTAAEKAQRKAELKAKLKAERAATRIPLGKANISAFPLAKGEILVPVIGTLLDRVLLPQEEQDDFRSSSRGYRRLAKVYGQIIAETTAVHDHHSLTPGRSDWARKWDTCTGKRILFFALSDYSGSFYKWAEAVNRHTPHAVRMVSMNRHRYGYPLDILYPRGDILVQRFPEILNDFLMLVDQADIVHIKDQTGFHDGRNHLPATLLSQFRKPIVYTLYGGTARQDEKNADFQRYVKSHAAVVAMTPDLCFDWMESTFIPHNVDEDTHPYSWQDGKIIMHTPSSPFRKGTDFFVPAAERVAQEIGGKVEVITGTKHDYIMRQKPLATIFFDQAGREIEKNGGKLIGWYGNSALEAAVYGVPTMAHLSQEAIERADRAGYSVVHESAILNVDPNEDGLYRVIRDFFDMSGDEREGVARQTRQWIEKHHSFRATSAKLDALYRSL